MPGGVGAKFGKELEEARTLAAGQIIDKSLDDAVSPKLRPRIQFQDAEDPFLKLAEMFPEAAVLQAYQELEACFDTNKDIIQSFDKSGQMRDSINTIIDGLRGARLLSDDWMELYKRIRKLRKLAVHGRRGQGRITPGEAIEYRALVNALKEQLSVAIREYRVRQ